MELIWLAFLGVLLTGYFALEGFDLGVGLLLPVLGRTQRRRDAMVSAIGPFVLANEVWLVAVAGVLFGAFPVLEGEVLFALYPLVVVMLLSWVLRDAGLWFRRRADGAAWRAGWDWVIAGGSLGLSFGWGVALYAIATGFDASLWHPLGLLLGVVVTLAFAFHGRTFLAGRVPEFAGWSGLPLSAALAALPVVAVLVAAVPALRDHAAPDETLGALSLMALPFVPFMIGAQVWVWRTFRRDAGRVPSFF
ncbi:cytochrome d ubiquinol oxidase subunit II [Thermomonospora umbrina]|uniref:Cytochrome bd-type quinol oxidase subunit 2 n=1 Tax=Thermomonospora umbrina TaxID=111806 RepID=A0A3D9SPS8_9ACTN|nr:cytochrome d ubiquinol oxidase subunit II [Thermomonospora umbrina]REE97617.1 cytochrome bd-type quinol oxidase subunit 2 [Thermomonospora umbrina]